MLCKNCNEKEGVKYSKYSCGEFCSQKCACSYSTKNKRKEINLKVSNTLSKPKIKRKCETCEKIFEVRKSKRNQRFCSRQCTDFTIYDKTKEILSQKRINYLQNNNHVKWYEVTNINGQNIKVQGKWELEFANRCNKLNILFLRHAIKFHKIHNYTPDFYLPKINVYIEIKGFLREFDKYKMLKVVEEHNINLKLIDQLFFIKNFKKEDLKILVNINNLFNYNDIDYTKFTTRYE